MMMTAEPALISPTIRGQRMTHGEGFCALGFREAQFSSLMDPLVMVDHFVMSEPTFGEHPHAGMSALSILFEDSVGVFNNRDSLGNNLNLKAGDVYWLKAGRGAVHDEKPAPGARTHGLQVFINLPAAMKRDTPTSRHVFADQVPVLEGLGYRVRVPLGESGGVRGAQSPALPLTLLDGLLGAGAVFSHELPAGYGAWVYAVRGALTLELDEREIVLREGESVAVRVDAQADLALQGEENSHFVVLAAEPLKESFVQKGPFVMRCVEDLAQAARDYANGRFGQL